MRTQVENLKSWFSSLSLREKQVVFFGGIVVGLFLIYEIIFSPLLSGVAELRTKVHSDANLLTWMQATNQRIHALEKSAQTSEPLSGSLISALQSSLGSTPFAKNISQLQQAEGDTVEVKLQNIPFDSFAKWLINFTQQNQLLITQLVATPEKDPGMVNIDLKLK